MRSTPPLCLLTLLLLAGCTQAKAPAEAQAHPGTPLANTAPGAVPASSAQTTCADADFASFLRRFEQSIDVQRAATADPLAMESVDAEAIPEPRPVTRHVPLAEVEFPILPDARRRESEGLEEAITEPARDRREVTHRIADSDAQIRYEFRAQPCWKLVRVSNDTL